MVRASGLQICLAGLASTPALETNAPSI